MDKKEKKKERGTDKIQPPDPSEVQFTGPPERTSDYTPLLLAQMDMVMQAQSVLGGVMLALETHPVMPFDGKKWVDFIRLLLEMFHRTLWSLKDQPEAMERVTEVFSQYAGMLASMSLTLTVPMEEMQEMEGEEDYEDYEETDEETEEE